MSAMVKPPVLLFLLRIALAISGLLCFHTEFRIYFSISVKNIFGILMEVLLNIKIAIGSLAIFTILILLLHEHSRAFYLLMYSLISIFSNL
jgi:hypothetical protein